MRGRFQQPLSSWQAKPAYCKQPHALPPEQPNRLARLDTGGGSGLGGRGGSGNTRRLETAESENNSNRPWGRAWLLLAVAVATTAFNWHRSASNSQPDEASATGRLSIIVPALNEERGIRATLQWLKSLQPAAHEIIVVDGGSSDRTVKVAEGEGVTVIQAPRGRCKQMNEGAKAASGNLLCFVHADSQPPLELVSVARRTLSNKHVVLGGFRTIIQLDGRVLWGMTAHQLVKTYYLPLIVRPLSFVRGLRCLFGDQSLFCRATDFARVGGFKDDLPIMEDVDLCIKLHMAGPADNPATKWARHRHYWSRRGHVRMVMNPPAKTSGRRLQAWGSLHATFVHFVIGLSWYFGASPEKMHSIYHSMYTDSYR
ncbi:hypothetical protein WJX72_003261 [[Myrmecia] bisecta]|uniref:Glycosyltransferase 2-like domain-containing protein n=1 Tax=[Myrmecia] bisecta TaxID=41462 RepID=A0AAW1Q5C3_9CHLO